MKTCISFLTKDRVELSKQTIPHLLSLQHGLFIIDGSDTVEGCSFPTQYSGQAVIYRDVKGGADAAIVFALTKMLNHRAKFEYVGLCENDVLLEPGWFEATMHLFEHPEVISDGLTVGAASPRAYVDRILIQRDGYAIMHNLGAGVVIFTREAAELVLANYRTGWWSDSRAIFAQLSEIDIGRYAAFRGNEQWTTADWHFDTVLAQAGLASLALTPSPVDMIGQVPSLAEQGLEIAKGPVEKRDGLGHAYAAFVTRTARIRLGNWKPETIKPIHRHRDSFIYFPHQLPNPVWEGNWKLQWSQGFGPFAWRSHAREAKLTVMLYGPVVFLVSGGKLGGKVKIVDTESGYEIAPELPANPAIVSLSVPAGVSYRALEMTCSEGVVFHGVQTSEPQPVSNAKFDHSSLPPV